MVRQQLFIGFALLAGVAVGYFVREGGESPEKEGGPSVVRRERGGKVADGGDAATIRSLRRRIAELERRLAELSASAGEAPATNAVAVAQQPARPGGGRGGFNDWLERLKKSDPARYTQETNRFASWRRMRAERARSTLDFLASVDTSGMSAAARKTHADLQEAVARREELEDSLRREDLSPEQRQQLFQEMREVHRDLMRLNGEERANLISETAKALGFEGEDAKEVSATIQEVINATGGGFGFPHRGAHPPPPPPQNRGG